MNFFAKIVSYSWISLTLKVWNNWIFMPKNHPDFDPNIRKKSNFRGKCGKCSKFFWLSWNTFEFLTQNWTFKTLEKSQFFRGKNRNSLIFFRIEYFWVLDWTRICQEFWRVLWTCQWHRGTNPRQRRQSGWVYSTLRKALQTCGDLWRSRWLGSFIQVDLRKISKKISKPKVQMRRRQWRLLGQDEDEILHWLFEADRWW